MQDADSVLVSFLRATNESEREQFLDELISVHAAPLIRQTIRRRLGVHAHQPLASGQGVDGEDIYRDIVAKLVKRLIELRSGEAPHAIDNFRRYVISVANNACNDYLRIKSPARSHLKDNLRSLLSRNHTFKTWKNDESKTLCGLSSWGETNLASEPANPDEGADWETEVETVSKTGRRASLSKIVAQIFRLSNRPIELDDLVEVVANLLDVRDYTPESLDQNQALSQRLIAPSFDPEALLLGREFLQQLWKVVERLPKNQFNAFCLSFADGKGEDLVSLLVYEGVVTVDQFREKLGVPEDEFLILWDRLPILDNAALAEYLGATVGQIGKWRFLASKQIRAELIGEK